MKEIGKGQISLEVRAEGEIRYITSVQEVVELWKEGAEGKIALVDDAGTTTLSPVLSKLGGVVCTSGGLGSHLAIVTREFDIPALMGLELENPETLDKSRVVIQPDGGTSGTLMSLD